MFYPTLTPGPSISKCRRRLKLDQKYETIVGCDLNEVLSKSIAERPHALNLTSSALRLEASICAHEARRAAFSQPIERLQNLGGCHHSAEDDDQSEHITVRQST